MPKTLPKIGSAANVVEVDAQGQPCPMPLLRAKRALNSVAAGQQIRVVCTDAGSIRDFEVFARQSGHKLLQSENNDGIYSYLLQKV